jgi:hypothetical protein
MKARKGFDHPLEEVRLPATTDQAISVSRIKNNGEIIRDSFTFYRKYFEQLLPWILVVTLMATTAEFFSPDERVLFLMPLDGGWSILNSMYYAMKTNSPFYILINTVAVSAILYRIFSLIIQDSQRRYRFRVVGIVQMLIVSGLAFASLYFMEGWGTLLLILFYSFFLFLAFQQLAENKLLPASCSRTWQLCSENFGQVVSMQFIMLMMSLSFLLILSAPLLYMNLSVMRWNFAASDTWAQSVVHYIEIFLKLFVFNLVLPVLGSAIAYLYFSLREIHSADHLKQTISTVDEKYVKGLRARA